MHVHDIDYWFLALVEVGFSPERDLFVKRKGKHFFLHHNTFDFFTSIFWSCL